MKKSEVVIGRHYKCRVSGVITVVKILAESPYGGWTAKNIKTGREVRIKSAQKLRTEYYDVRETPQ
jgi:hypothetical protein